MTETDEVEAVEEEVVPVPEDGPSPEQIAQWEAEARERQELIEKIDKSLKAEPLQRCKSCGESVIRRATSAFGRVNVQLGNNPDESYQAKDPRNRLPETTYYNLLRITNEDVIHSSVCGGKK